MYIYFYYTDIVVAKTNKSFSIEFLSFEKKKAAPIIDNKTPDGGHKYSIPPLFAGVRKNSIHAMEFRSNW